VENVEIARVLDDVAVLLEIQGANPFRIRAYDNAARTIEEHSEPLRKMVERGDDLTELPGIGKDMAGHITELVESGRLSLLDELTEETPYSLIELTRLPGVGAKKTKKLWEELEVETIDQLEAAARADRVKALAGFGAKSQQKMLDGIAAYRRRQGRVRLAEADQLVEPLLAYLREDDAVTRVEVAGSYRRRRETVGDIDLLAITDEPAHVVERFTSYDKVKRVELAGDTKATVVLTSGLQVDLRLLPAASYGAALQYFTGSKAHNVKFRKRAVAQGLRVSEYGVLETDEPADEADAEQTDVTAGKRVAGETEESVYEAVGVPMMPPELREDRGEIEAALEGSLPDLVTLDAMRGDLQMHSTWSDGKNSIEEMLDGCVALGYEYFAITDHSKALAMTGGLDAARLRRQWEEIDEIADRRDEVRILKGMETDILADGTLDLEDELLQELDVVVVSVHSKLDLAAAKQTDRILKAVSHPAVHILAHPTGRLINRRDPMAFDLDTVLQACAEHDVIVESNAHPDRLDLKDTHLLRAKELGLQVAISTDAHRVDDLDLMRYGIDQARRGWLTPDDVVNTWPLKRLLKRLRAKQS
jgi:DNA polymerase (family 10)